MSPSPSDPPSEPLPNAAPERAPPAVVGLSREERAAAERRAELRRSLPGLAVAVVAHLGVLWWLAVLAVGDGGLFEERLEIRASAEDDIIAPPPPVDEEPPPLEVPDEIVPEPEITEVLEEQAAREDDVAFDVIGLGGGYGAAGAGGGIGGRGGADDEGGLEAFGEGDSPFRAFVEDLRGRGMDVVFVVDATASMGPFITAARAAIDDVIADLALVVPSLRLGIVAYRDVTDEWLTRSVDLTDDRYRIQNFLLDLTWAGGGDPPEAVDKALELAFDEFTWRPGARQVVIVVGDAPPHEEDQSRTLAMVRAFSRDRNSLVNVLFTGAGMTGLSNKRVDETRAVLERLAGTGGGLIADLTEDPADLRQRITDASFGTEWREDVARLIGQADVDSRERIVQEKVARGDRKWFIRQIRRDPVPPALVAGYIELCEGSMASAVLELLLDEGQPKRLRSVALFVLKSRLTGEFPLDVGVPLAEQGPVVGALTRAVGRLPGARPAAPGAGEQREAPPVPPR